MMEGVSFGIFDTDNAFRNYLSNIVSSGYFEAFILVLILVTILIMAVESPLDDPKS